MQYYCSTVHFASSIENGALICCREDWDLGGSGGPTEDKTRPPEDCKVSALTQEVKAVCMSICISCVKQNVKTARLVENDLDGATTSLTVDKEDGWMKKDATHLQLSVN